MKTIYTFLLAFLMTGLIAQSNLQTVYLNTNSVDYLQEASVELENVVLAVEKALEDNDNNLATKSKSKMLSIVSKATTSSQNLCNLLDMTLSTEDAAPDRYEMSKEEFEKSMSDDVRNQRLSISKDESVKLAGFAERMMALRTQLKTNKFEIHPTQDNTKANIALLKQYSELLNQTAALYSNAQRRS